MHLASVRRSRALALIDQAVRAGGWPNACTLAARMEVMHAPSSVTFTSCAIGFRPLEFYPVRNGYRYTDATYQLPFFRLTEGELVAVFLAERLLQQYQVLPSRRTFAVPSPRSPKPCQARSPST